MEKTLETIETSSKKEEEKKPLHNTSLVVPVDSPVVIGVAWALMKEFTPNTIPIWHSNDHNISREDMRLKLSQLIQQRRPNPTKEWLDKLHDICIKLDDRLYYQARNFDEYNDPNTLLERLGALVLSSAVEGKSGVDSDPSDETCSSDDETNSKFDVKETKTPRKIFTSRQVSSQGCSRVFIVKVLASVSEFVSGKLLPSIFTFPRELVVNWLQKAKEACSNPSILAEEEYYGGPPFAIDDPSTHWTEPHQLYTWWKNNVERKVKYKILQEDATYGGPDQRRISRARWCAVVVSLAEVIRCSSGSSLQYKSLIPPSVASDSTNVETILTSSSPRAPHEGILPPYSLPSLQYAPSQFNRMRSGFKTFGINGINNIAARGTEVGQSPLMKNLLATSDLLGSNSNRVTENDEANKLPSRVLGSQGYAYDLYLGDGNNLTDAHQSTPVTTPYNVTKQLSPWGDEIDISKIMQGPPKFPPNWRDRWNQDENVKASEIMRLSAQRKIFTSMKDQVKPQVNNNPASKGYQQAFPLKLYDLVTEQNNDIIGWLPEGTAFKVKNMESFVNIILPAYFKHGNFTSFQRQLNLYGFRRTKESDKGAYYHSHFISGRRDLAAGIRRLLTSHPHHHPISGVPEFAENANLDNLSAPLPPPPPPPPEPIPEPPPVEVVAAPVGRRKSQVERQKGPTHKLLSQTPDGKENSVTKSSKDIESNISAKREYGTRRKRQKKQYDEFVPTEDVKRPRKEAIESDDDGGDEQDIKNEYNLPMVYVSGLNSAQECEEVIDMTCLPTQRRRLATRRIVIDMTPTLNNRPATITETHLEPVKKKIQQQAIKKNEDSGSIYNTTLKSVSHSKYTRVGDEYQAIIPEICPDLNSTLESLEQSYPPLSDEAYKEYQIAQRKREQTFLAFSASEIIVAVIPNSTTRRQRKMNVSPQCILANKELRLQLLDSQFLSPPECYMSIEMKKTLFPRLCVAIRKLQLYVVERISPDERPILYFRPENDDILIQSPLWACEYRDEDDSSDSDFEFKENDPRHRDMSALLSNRYVGDQTTFLEVTDGSQNWIVPLSVCSSAGSLEYHNYFLDTMQPSDVKEILEDDMNKPQRKFTSGELRRLASIDATLNEDFSVISPALRRNNENLSKAWKELQTTQVTPVWLSSMKEFVCFCNRYCPHPGDSISDGRMVAMRKLINMTSDVEITSRLDEISIPNANVVIPTRNPKPSRIANLEYAHSLLKDVVHSDFEAEESESTVSDDLADEESPSPIRRKEVTFSNLPRRNTRGRKSTEELSLQIDSDPAVAESGVKTRGTLRRRTR